MPPTEGQKAVVLFIHGFGSSHKCWNRMLELLRQDPAITSRYELATWDYPTKWVELNLLGRIPSLKELGRSLADEIDSPAYRGRSLTLVGHSQGGLVIQSYFADQLQAGQASKLAKVLQAIFIATPCEGSVAGWNMRRLASTLFHNPQELTLRVLNPDIADMRAVIQERAVGATSDSANCWRIPIHAFCGLQDNVVPEASARGPFLSVKRVPGDHFSILRPTDHKDPRYREFAELLLEPVGHPERFEIESYETKLRIEPRPKATIWTKNKTPRLVEYDDYATLRRTVRFAPGNRCKNCCVIQYRTRNDGYVVGHISHANEAPPQDIGRWHDEGTCFRFDFTPQRDQGFCLEVDVYGGYGPGQRDVHFHLGDKSHFRRMKYELDLSKYMGNGYMVSEEPRLYLTPGSCQCQEFGLKRRALEPMPLVSRTDGRYVWEFEDVYCATVDLVWDVAAVLEPVSVKVEPTSERLANG